MSTEKTRVRRTFSNEFKRDAVNLVVVEGDSFKAAAEAVGVSSRSLRGWHEKLAPKPEPCGDDASLQQLQEENRRLRKELKRAEVEREILKKATQFFASQKP